MCYLFSYFAFIQSLYESVWGVVFTDEHTVRSTDITAFWEKKTSIQWKERKKLSDPNFTFSRVVNGKKNPPCGHPGDIGHNTLSRTNGHHLHVAPPGEERTNHHHPFIVRLIISIFPYTLWRHLLWKAYEIHYSTTTSVLWISQRKL